ncbi:MAG: xanthine dehydrogenase molybdopterin binding subunit [Cyanobacteria bacterium]|nr:xanthine dehydrogenase molybdopterin binding subunit [Cyanobacteriota bacterium]
MGKGIGTSHSHESAIGHVTGQAIYTDDQRRLAGMLHLWPVQAPHAHARIVRMDVAAAAAVAGVITTVTAADITGVNNIGSIVADEELLPIDRVSYWGQAVAWVVGETEEAARLGALQVEIEYEPLEPLLDLAEAIAQHSFHGGTQTVQRGDPITALAQAETRLRGEVTMGGQDHFYLETHASWVIPAPDGSYQVYAGTQHPTETQAAIAHILDIPRSHVVVTCLRMGGGFGGKETQANLMAAAAAIAAQKTGRPVRVRLNRQQDMTMTGKRHSFLAQYQVGFTHEGMITAVDVDLFADGGWSTDLSPLVVQAAVLRIDNAYYVPDFAVRGRVVKTHKVSNTAFRGFGSPQGVFVMEEIVERVAHTLGLPPDQVRERNFYRGSGETNTTPYGQEVRDNRIQRIWDELKTTANFEVRQGEVAQFNATHPHRKRGLSICPIKFGISFTSQTPNQAGALILIYLDGSIQLNHGGTEMGQGLHTKMLQVAARALGVKLSRFRIMPTSTDKVPNTSATAASSGSDLNGQAVKDACDGIKARLSPVAARMLDLYAPEELVFADDWVYCAGQPDCRVSFDAVVQEAYNRRVSLSATGYYRTPNIYFDKETGQGRPFYYFVYSAAVSEVEVDGFTGTFKLRRVDIVHDVGESLNPLVDRGQIEGAFTQGMGWLTMEELVWAADGRPLVTAPSTYKIPTISEIPEQFNVHLLTRASQDGTIYGSKAVGEPPLLLAFSVRQALRAAAIAFGETDWVPLASPATPEAILHAIESAKSAASVSVKSD